MSIYACEFMLETGMLTRIVVWFSIQNWAVALAFESRIIFHIQFNCPTLFQVRSLSIKSVIYHLIYHVYFCLVTGRHRIQVNVLVQARKG